MPSSSFCKSCNTTEHIAVKDMVHILRYHPNLVKGYGKIGKSRVAAPNKGKMNEVQSLRCLNLKFRSLEDTGATKKMKLAPTNKRGLNSEPHISRKRQRSDQKRRRKSRYFGTTSTWTTVRGMTWMRSDRVIPLLTSETSQLKVQQLCTICKRCNFSSCLWDCPFQSYFSPDSKNPQSCMTPGESVGRLSCLFRLYRNFLGCSTLIGMSF